MRTLRIAVWLESAKRLRGVVKASTPKEYTRSDAHSIDFGGWVKLTATALAALFSLSAGRPALASVNDGGDYIPAPIGTQLAIYYQQFASSKGLYADGKDVSPNAELSSDVSLFRYLAYRSVFGYEVDYQIIQPVVDVHGGGATKSLGTAAGIGDTILLGTVWLYNNPKAKSYFGITPFVYIPDGQYDRHAPISIGANRWQGELQAGYTKGFGDHFVAEAIGDVNVYSNNKAFNVNQTMKQTASYTAQGFLRYLIDNKNEFNVRTVFYYGGDEHVDGLDEKDKTQTWSMLATYVRALPNNFQLMLQGGRDISVKSGFEEKERFQFRVVKAF